MNLTITLTNRKNTYSATAVYDGQMVTIKSGAKLFPTFSTCIRGGKTALKFRSNSDYVDSNYVLLKDCSFNSPSTAAQFVTGRSVSGYNVWKVNGKKTLGEYLKEQGLR